MSTIIINTHRPYPVHVGPGLLHDQRLIECCRGLASEWVIITDDNVKMHYAQPLLAFLSDHLSIHLISIAPGEQNKTREVKADIEDQMQALGCGRDAGILALGGGVITDLAGFLASTYCRGIPVVYLPTTLLAMVDATVGGKTGVNTAFGKNLIGTFTQPSVVFADINVLATLDQSNFINGVIESIKHALISDAGFFDFIENNAEKILNREGGVILKLISQSIEIKREIIELDELDKGKRALCNYGHTIGHALETYFNFTISHGVAVALGMIVEGYFSTQIAHLSQDDYLRIKSILSKFGVAVDLHQHHVDYQALKAVLQNDKKTIAKTPHFVLLSAIGVPWVSSIGYISSVPDHLIEEAIQLI